MPPTPPTPHHSIESLTVSRGIHFRDVTFEFHDLLNFLIGARGTGKSGALHLIRFALGAPIPEAYAEDFDDYIEGTLGTGTATVAVRTRHGVRYTSSRTHGSLPVVKDENGKVVDVKLVGELFQIQAYAQNELEGIAKSAASQLALIDSFADAEIRAIDDAVAQVERKVMESAARLSELDVGDELLRRAPSRGGARAGGEGGDRAGGEVLPAPAAMAPPPEMTCSRPNKLPRPASGAEHSSHFLEGPRVSRSHFSREVPPPICHPESRSDEGPPRHLFPLEDPRPEAPHGVRPLDERNLPRPAPPLDLFLSLSLDRGQNGQGGPRVARIREGDRQIAARHAERFR